MREIMKVADTHHASRGLEAVVHDGVLLGREERSELLRRQHLLAHRRGDAHLLLDGHGGLAERALVDDRGGRSSGRRGSSSHRGLGR